jgi:uncharacterized protein YukE
MSQKEGMDPVVVRELAGRLDVQGNAIEGVLRKVDGIVANLEHVWRGHTATQFKGWWEQQHRPHLANVRDAVHGLATSARNNAAQQDGASAAGGGAGSGGHAQNHQGSGVAAPVPSTSGHAVLTGVTTSDGSGQSHPTGPGGSVQQGILQIAKSQATAGPGDSSGQHYVSTAALDQYLAAGGSRQGTPWCADFVAWVLKQNNHAVPPGAASVGSWVTAAQNHQDGLSITTEPQPGDVVAYSGPDGWEHIGIVTQAPVNGHFQALSGNWWGEGDNVHVEVGYTSPGSKWGTIGDPAGLTPTFIHVS